MIIAESKDKISHPYLQFLMGHKGDIEARYSTNKGVLPPDMVEDMRNAYKACKSFLTTLIKPLEESLEIYLAIGWQFTTTLPNQKILIKKPYKLNKPSFDFSGKIKKIKILRVESFKKSKKIKN